LDDILERGWTRGLGDEKNSTGLFVTALGHLRGKKLKSGQKKCRRWTEYLERGQHRQSSRAVVDS